MRKEHGTGQCIDHIALADHGFPLIGAIGSGWHGASSLSWGNAKITQSLPLMERTFLTIALASIVLLVFALALVAPPIDNQSTARAVALFQAR